MIPFRLPVCLCLYGETQKQSDFVLSAARAPPGKRHRLNGTVCPHSQTELLIGSLEGDLIWRQGLYRDG